MRSSNSDIFKKSFEAFLASNNLTSKYKEAQVLNNWGNIVGITIAKSTKKVEIRNGTLYIHVNSSIIRNELLMLKSNIIDVVNSKANMQIINNVVII